jgi:hypothetical protein
MLRNKALKRYNQFTPVKRFGIGGNRKSLVYTDLKKFNQPKFCLETETSHDL